MSTTTRTGTGTGICSVHESMDSAAIRPAVPDGACIATATSALGRAPDSNGSAAHAAPAWWGTWATAKRVAS